MKKPSLDGTLGDVFRVLGRGTILMVENCTGEMPSTAEVRVGSFTSKIVSFDFPRKTIRKNESLFELDFSIIGLSVEEDVRENLLEMTGQPVEVYEV